MEELSKEFPVLSEYTYLNTASCGLVSKSLVAWRKAHDEQLLKYGSIFRDLHKPHIERIRATVARFFRASENEVALVPNFSFGFNTLMSGIPKTKKVLLLSGDYPSINWAVENHGFEVYYAKIDENLEQNIEEAISTCQPDVFAFSIVQYISGIKIDFEFLKRLKAYHPNLLIIGDGTQYVGTESFNFSDSPFDVVGASGYKWLLSGYGNAFFMIKNEVQPGILPSTVGFNSSNAIYSRRDEITFVKQFEPGHQDTLNYGCLEQSINAIEAIGPHELWDKIAKISTKAKVKFVELGLLDSKVVNRDIHSNIFNLKGDSSLFQKLKDRGIICSQRGNGIRVSFHFYNTEDDLNKLVLIMKEQL